MPRSGLSSGFCSAPEMEAAVPLIGLAPRRRFSPRALKRGAVIAFFLAPSLAIFLLYRVLPLFWNMVPILPVLVPAAPRALCRRGQLH